MKGGELLAEFALDEDLSALVGDKGELSQKTRLGRLIHSRIGVVTGGFRVAQGTSRAGSSTYRLEDLRSQTPPQTPPNDLGSNGGVGGGVQSDISGSNGGVGGVYSQSSAHTRACTREQGEKNPPTPPTGSNSPENPTDKPHQTPVDDDGWETL